MYIENVTAEIAARYDDITKEFARSIIATHRLGCDPNGILTQRKEVLEVHDENTQQIGFTTLTYKVGGSIKTGPTVLFPEFRRRGFGQAVRKAIETYAVAAGARKIYCTCPDSDPQTVAYIMKAGFQIEAHLVQHYRVDRGELVFGKILRLAPAEINPTATFRSLATVCECHAFQATTLRRDITAILSSSFPGIKKDAVRSVIERASNSNAKSYEEKPLNMLCLKQARLVLE